MILIAMHCSNNDNGNYTMIAVHCNDNDNDNDSSAVHCSYNDDDNDSMVAVQCTVATMTIYLLTIIAVHCAGVQ